MSYSKEMNFNKNLLALVEEYFSFTKGTVCSNQDPQLLRFDIFVKQSKQSKKPTGWHLALLLDDGQKQRLVDSAMNILCQYDEILPLFDVNEDEETANAVMAFQEKLLELNQRPLYEKRLCASLALRTLCSPFCSLSAAYLVNENGLYGVVDPFGKVIIAPKYQHIEPFAFREHYDYPSDCGGPIHGGIWGDTSLYLCTEDPTRLNTMDVYDLRGNCVFERIASLYAHKETLSTPYPITEACAPQLPLQKDVRSVWVNVQSYGTPFPEDPELQILCDNAASYTIKKLCDRAPSLRSAPLWNKDFCHYQTECCLEEPPKELLRILEPIISLISANIGCSPEGIIARLPDYADFRWERTPIQFSLTNVTPHSTLDDLDLPVRTYNCLNRASIRTLNAILHLPDEAIPTLRGANSKIIREIAALKKCVETILSDT